MTKWKAAQFLMACVMGFWAASAFGGNLYNPVIDSCTGTRFPEVDWCQHQTPTREAEMVNISPSERIAGDLAAYIGPNWRDYRPVSEMTTEYIHRFGTVKLGDIREVSWIAFLEWAELDAPTWS